MPTGAAFSFLTIVSFSPRLVAVHETAAVNKDGGEEYEQDKPEKDRAAGHSSSRSGREVSSFFSASIVRLIEIT